MKTTLYIIFSIIVALGLIFLATRNPLDSAVAETRNVSIVDGVQVIQITAKGGYSPRLTAAQAGIPTVIRFQTQGAFDCSLALRIPALKVAQNLPQTGTTEIAVGTPSAGPLLGTCSMGMYRFQINFEG